VYFFRLLRTEVFAMPVHKCTDCMMIFI